MKPSQVIALREVFPPEAIGKLPKGGAQLDYVGHAAVTARLLDVDPEWTWEPVAFDTTGLPAYDAKGGLWIRLTVGGVTRLGYGDGPDPKQRIGDAIRNAAMRFGVALDLWAKDDISGVTTEAEDLPVRAKTARRKSTPAPPSREPAFTPHANGVTRAQLTEIVRMLKDLGITERNDSLDKASALAGRAVSSANDLTAEEAQRVIAALALELGEVA